MSRQYVGELLPDRLRGLWKSGEESGVSGSDLWSRQQRELAAYASGWMQALSLPGTVDLKSSLLEEIRGYLGHAHSLEDIEKRCRGAVEAVKLEWQARGADAADRNAVEKFYDGTEAYIFELIWWHTLVDDMSPLAYMVGRDLAQQRGCRRYLDFGAGVGSAGILFAQAGFEVSLADISSSLLGFADWRLRRREMACRLIDLKKEPLPSSAYDFVTAMDVWEHLVDPVATVDVIADAMAVGGILFGRFAAEVDANYPQHIVTDFAPTFDRLAARGFVEVWRDQWLWGHQAFRKS